VAPAIASAFLERVLQPVSDIAMSYVDNIVIRTTVEDKAAHYRDVCRVLDVLHKAGVTLNLSSSVWAGTREVPVLGILWSAGSIRLSNDRVGDFLRMPKPVKLAQVRSMNAALSTMANFIPNAQILAAPFNDLISAGKAFKWTETLEKQWLAIQEAVSHALTTHYPESGEELVVRSDASQIGWGGALSVRRNGVELPVVFLSRTWKGSEGGYTAVRREATGLFNVVSRLQPYTRGEQSVR
jgi:hypothetical protein